MKWEPCLLLLLLITLCHEGEGEGKGGEEDEDSHYTNSWVVELVGERGHETAEKLAKTHGFINKGQVRVYH